MLYTGIFYILDFQESERAAGYRNIRFDLKAFNYCDYKKDSRWIKTLIEHEFDIVMNHKMFQHIMRKYDI